MSKEHSEYMERVLQKMIELKTILQEEPEQDDDPFRFMATAPMYTSWILDDLVAIFLVCHLGGKPRLMVRAIRGLLSILEESNRHAEWAKEILDAGREEDQKDD